MGRTMRKSTITRLWLGGMVAIALGLVAAGVAVGAIFWSSGTFTTGTNGDLYNFVPRQDGYFWSWVAVIVVGGLVALVGGIAQFVAWIGAMANAYRLPDKMWFLLTLLLGLFGFGLIVMIVYLLLAPDAYDDRETLAPRGAALPPTYAPSH
jgi:hypothetical protein